MPALRFGMEKTPLDAVTTLATGGTIAAGAFGRGGASWPYDKMAPPIPVPSGACTTPLMEPVPCCATAGMADAKRYEIRRTLTAPGEVPRCLAPFKTDILHCWLRTTQGDIGARGMSPSADRSSERIKFNVIYM